MYFKVKLALSKGYNKFKFCALKEQSSGNQKNGFIRHTT